MKAQTTLKASKERDKARERGQNTFENLPPVKMFDIRIGQPA